MVAVENPPSKISRVENKIENKVDSLLAETRKFAYFIERLQSGGLEVTAYDGETLAKFADKAKVFRMEKFNKFSMILENEVSRIFLTLEKVYKTDAAGPYPQVDLRVGLASRYSVLSKLDIDSCNFTCGINGVEYISVPSLVVAPIMTFHDNFDNLVEVHLEKGVFTNYFHR